MGRCYKYLPPFAPDYSGVASVFYELGALIVINGVDGCTRNYLRYDEPRILTKASAVYSTGLQELHAITGNEDVILAGIKKELSTSHPPFIVLLGTPNSSIIGMDLHGIGEFLKSEIDLPILSFETNGIDTYEKGASSAYLAMAQELVSAPTVTDGISINLIGATPLDYWPMSQIDMLKMEFERAGIRINSCWSMGLRVKKISKALSASLNVVVSTAGLRASRYMKEKYKIPYIVGVPVGKKHTHLFIENVKSKIRDNEELEKYNELKQEYIKGKERTKVLIVGDQIWANSYREALRFEQGLNDAVVASFFTMEPSLALPGDQQIKSEKDLFAIIKELSPRIIVGDPLLEPFIPAKTKHVLIPHGAVSGRLYYNHRIRETL